MFYGDNDYGDGNYGDSSSCEAGGGSDVDNANCTKPLARGNESCSFVRSSCSDDVALANYLAFIACDLPHVKVRDCWVGLKVLHVYYGFTLHSQRVR